MGFGGKIAIGIPHVGDIKSYFFDTVMGLSKPANTAIIRVENKPIDLARNEIVEAALADPTVTHLFFMDADMQFPAEALQRLILDDKDVVGGIYFARTADPVPHAYNFHHQDNDDGSCPVGLTHSRGYGRWYQPLAKEFAAYMKRHPEYEDLPAMTILPSTPDALVRCATLATGCMLIKRGVLEAMEWPYFKCHERSAGGEDFYFCDKATALGFEVWADFALQCAHEFRWAWMDRFDFKERFRVGEADEHNFDVIVDASPGAGSEIVTERLAFESEAG